MASRFQVTVTETHGDRYAVIRTIQRHGSPPEKPRSLFSGVDRKVLHLK